MFEKTAKFSAMQQTLFSCWTHARTRQCKTKLFIEFIIAAENSFWKWLFCNNAYVSSRHTSIAQIFFLSTTCSLFFCGQVKSCNSEMVLCDTISFDWSVLIATLIASEHNALIVIAGGFDDGSNYGHDSCSSEVSIHWSSRFHRKWMTQTHKQIEASFHAVCLQLMRDHEVLPPLRGTANCHSGSPPLRDKYGNTCQRMMLQTGRKNERWLPFGIQTNFFYQVVLLLRRNDQLWERSTPALVCSNQSARTGYWSTRNRHTTCLMIVFVMFCCGSQKDAAILWIALQTFA